MRTFSENYDFEAKAILRDLGMYKLLTKEQLMRLYPGKERKVEKLLPYMRRQCRVWKVGDYYCTSPELAEHVDHAMLSAVWVLLDFIDQVSFHAAAEPPAKLVFVVEEEIYEVVYAGLGLETLVNCAKSLKGEERTNHLILVDRPEQIRELDVPNTCGFCTVSPAGEVEYYQKE